MRQLNARVSAHANIAPGHYRLSLHAPGVVAAARAGQFVHVLPRQAALFDPLLRRAFSIAATHGEEFDIIYRVEGRGTALLSHIAAGETLDILGPLGRPFLVQPGAMVLVGGGVGVPPLRMLAQQERGQDSNRRIDALLGARSANDLLCIEEFGALRVATAVATDDGSAGLHGRVTELLKQRLEADSDSPPAVYACGPLPMLRAVAELCAGYGAPCQVSLEENMPCGVGVCNGCVVAAQDPGDDYGRYRRICVEGPVIPAQEIAW